MAVCRRALTEYIVPVYRPILTEYTHTGCPLTWLYLGDWLRSSPSRRGIGCDCMLVRAVFRKCHRSSAGVPGMSSLLLSSLLVINHVHKIWVTRCCSLADLVLRSASIRRNKTKTLKKNPQNSNSSFWPH